MLYRGAARGIDREEIVRRRTLFQACTAAAGCIAFPGALLAESNLSFRPYRQVLLVDERERPLRAGDVAAGVNYVFHYPHVGTPCFLLHLDVPLRPVRLRNRHGEDYLWQGGVGKDGRLVGYSAICAHRMAHPTASISFISFRPDLRNRGSGAGVITCCAEGSVYDPAEGGRVLGGPADQPLAAVVLEHDETDGSLYAVGMVGGDVFDRYFTEYGERLRLEYLGREPELLVESHSVVRQLGDFSRQVVRCTGAGTTA